MVNLTLGSQEWFPSVGKIPYEGPQSDNPLAFRWYNPSQIVAGKSMADHFKFACSYWHSFCGAGGDPFGPGTRPLPWNGSSDVMQRAKDKMDAAFEFMTKMGMEYYCFHDVDLVDDAGTLLDLEKRVQQITDYALEKQAASGVKLLWGTANLFSNPRYMNGASTNPDFRVLTCGAAQVKNAIDATIKLGGTGYVFWGGREGYMSLLNTDMKREQAHLAKFLQLSRDYARKQGFTGTFFIEPKPAEPSKHQYDFDCATVLGFLREHDLLDDFALNIEVNHATLAGHTFEHELAVAAAAGKLGSIDANRGDNQNGWDTDQFPYSINELTEAMLVILQTEGFTHGGVNFDAKVRRNSTDPEDLFYAHIGGMDVFAKSLLLAQAILDDGTYLRAKSSRYASYDSGDGASFEQGNLTLEALHALALQTPEPTLTSGRQEWYENIVNRFIMGA